MGGDGRGTNDGRCYLKSKLIFFLKWCNSLANHAIGVPFDLLVAYVTVLTLRMLLSSFI